jgi:hypothetical protein
MREFDLHRTGDLPRNLSPGQAGKYRRCLSTEEMQQAGFHLNSFKNWTTRPTSFIFNDPLRQETALQEKVVG